MNIVSKVMQSSTMEINSAVQLLESCTKYLTEYRSTKGSERAVVDTRELAKALDVEPIFVEKRLRRKKRMFDYEGNDNVIIDPEQSFRINVLNKILDDAISSLQSRFEQTKEFRQYWGFLFDFKKIPSSNELLKLCKDLDIILSDGDDSDISGTELCDEIQLIKTLLSGDVNSPLTILQYFKIN
jgi:hypothetical protein